MCGICGILDFKGELVSEETLRRMCEALKHRGPDDEGIYISKTSGQRSKGSVGLGHRRLSIIDLQGGHQPMANEDKTIWVVCNGEIYNFLVLKAEMETKGHKFSTQSDTEVIVHLYEEYGEECLKYLRGMFTLAVWDDRKGKLFLARDRVGQKPLYYTETNGRFIFASEIKSILQVEGVLREINPESLHHYLTYQYVPAPLTMFKGIYKLLPAHFLIRDKDRLKIERYWQLNFQPKNDMPEEECRERVASLFEDAVRLRLVSDVSLGAFLSGGIDSTLTVGMMSKLISKPLKTFSIGFEEKKYNELPYARLAARRFGTEHHEFMVKPETLKILPRLIWHYGEPFADSSAIPTYYLAEKTREHVAVALNGDGGDESFAGYPRYRAMILAEHYRKLPHWMRETLLRRLVMNIPSSVEAKTLRRRCKRFFEHVSLPPERRYLQWISFFDESMKKELYSSRMKELTSEANSFSLFETIYQQADGKSVLDKILYADIMTYLPDDLLVKVDVATMANSLEARAPFLDHKLIEFAAGLPSSLKLKGITSKYILKKSLKEFLPLPIRYRSKMGFGVPISRWLGNELKGYLSEIIFSETSLRRDYFQESYLRQLFDEHVQGKRDHGYRLWALLNLELWQRMFIDPPSIKTEL